MFGSLMVQRAPQDRGEVARRPPRERTREHLGGVVGQPATASCEPPRRREVVERDHRIDTGVEECPPQREVLVDRGG